MSDTKPTIDAPYVRERARMKELRGEVLERFAELENTIDFTIAIHYGKKGAQFLDEVMTDEYVSWALRRSLFKKVARALSVFDAKQDENLARLGSLRNLFAHASKRVTEITPDFTYGGSYYVSPKDPAKRFDPEPSFEEFTRLAGEVQKYLAILHTAVAATLPSTPVVHTPDQPGERS